MGYIGRKFRVRRILFPDSRRGLIVPVDHGLTLGPIPGMRSTDDLKEWVGSSAISAVLGHKGMVERLIERNMLHPSTGVIVHLNGMASIAAQADTKIMVSDVDAALRLGADAVSVQVNFTAANFEHNLALLGAVTDAAHGAGLPLLVMLYDKVNVPSGEDRVNRLNHLLRVVTEMGADAVKLALPESMAEVEDLIARHSRDTRIFFAGGERGTEEALFRATRAALEAGASGLCAGRNVFQHPQPRDFLRRLADCVQQHAARRSETFDLA
jgi:class I fructose-bisphosphate aldolase